MHRLRTGLLGALLFLLPGAVAAFDTVLETEHMQLLYLDGPQGYIAPHTARTFENAYAFYARLFNYTPSEKVTVILADVADYGNAAAWVAPRNTIFMHMAPPNFVYETGPSNERMNFTMNHEMAHIVGHDQSAGWDSFFRSVFFGKVRAEARHPESIVYSYLTVPRRTAPRWYHEGLAVFFETWMAGGIGRVLGSYDEMVFRAMVADSTRFYDPMGLESEGTRIDFQVGINSYLYGTRFVSYVALRYSPEQLATWLGREPGSKRNYTSQFKQVFGLDMNDAWQDWIEWERGFQQANLDSIRQYPTTRSVDLSRNPLGSVSRMFRDDVTGDLYVALNYPGTVGHIAAIEPDGDIRKLEDVKGPAMYYVTHLAWDPDGRRLFYTTDNNELRDLQVLDVDTGDSRRLKKDARIGDLVFNRADRSLWGIRHFNGYASIVRMPEPYREWHRIHTWPYGQIMYDIDISPDGSLLVGSLAHINGDQTLITMPTDSLLAGATAHRTLYDFGTSLPANFVFSPDGRYLYGSSYYTGVSNVFRYELATADIQAITNAETGFFRPTPDGADSLLAFRYTGDGFMPCRIPDTPLEDVSAITFLGQRIVEEHPVVRDWLLGSPADVDLDSLTVGKTGYNSFSRVGLASAYPVVEGYKHHAAVGVAMEFTDPAYVNFLSLSVSYTPSTDLAEEERLHADVRYERAGWKLRFRSNWADFYDLFGPTQTSRKGQALGLGWSRGLIYDSPRSLNLDLGVTGYTGLEVLPNAQNVPSSSHQLLTLYGRLKYKNLRSSLGAVDYEKGFQWELLSASKYVPATEYQDDDFFTQVIGNIDVGLPLISHSSVWWRNSLGYSPGMRDEPSANFYFGAFGNNYVDHQGIRRYREYYSFPGVELNEIAGTNYVKSMLELSLPPIRFRRLGVPTLFATHLSGAIFAGGLVTNLDEASVRTESANLGGQIDLRFMLLSNLKITLSGGYAVAVREHERRTDEFMGSIKIL